MLCLGCHELHQVCLGSSSYLKDFEKKNETTGLVIIITLCVQK